MMRLSALLMLAVAGTATHVRRGATLSAAHEAHVDGYTMSAVWMQRDGVVEEHPLRISDAVRRAAGELSVGRNINVKEPSRDRTLLIAKLQLLTSLSTEIDNDTANVLAMGDGFFSHDLDGEMAATLALLADVRAEIGNLDSFSNETNPHKAGMEGSFVQRFGFDKMGQVVANTWTSLEPNRFTGMPTTVLVFSGARTNLDYADTFMMSAPYVADKGNNAMKKAWLDAGLEWGPEQRQNEATREGERFSKIHREQTKWATAAIYAAGGAPLLAKTGVTPVVLAMAESFYEYALESRSFPMIAGHSLGGQRAAASSMHLRGKYGAEVPTLTFAGVGAACWPKGVATGWSFSSIDTTIAHPYITEYMHPLDFKGSSMGAEVGTVCKIGVANKRGLDRAVRQCGPLFGKSLAKLLIDAAKPPMREFRQTIVDGGAGLGLPVSVMETVAGIVLHKIRDFVSPISEEDARDSLQMDRCSYVTHTFMAIYQNLLEDLNEDGSTGSGCTALAGTPDNSDVCKATPYDDDKLVRGCARCGNGCYSRFADMCVPGWKWWCDVTFQTWCPSVF